MKDIISMPKHFFAFSEDGKAAMRSTLREHSKEYHEFGSCDAAADVILESIWNAGVDHR